MIEKLDRRLRQERDSGFTISEPVSIGEMQEKINELVDAVNALVYENDKDSDWYDRQTRSENVQDKFAEQRKWIGKLCKFWDIDNNNLYYGPLTKIHDTSPYCYECNHKICYANCEPVKPDDDLIYQGE